MRTFLPAPLLGVVMFLLLALNTLVWILPVYLLILAKLLMPPRSRVRIRLSRWMAALAQGWASVNVWFGDRLLGTQWDLRGVEQLDRNGQYLVCCNHQTYNDIYVLMKAFDRRAPFFKFFIKQQLIWVPVLGLVWWGLDYPFMKRHTPEQIAKNPTLRGQDLATTRKACEKYREQPVTILNFLEGTRFTRAKHDRQQSPYRHLLRPKSGGLAFTLAAMGDRLSALLDVTIVYPDGAKGFWQFLCGRVRRVIVDVRPLAIPRQFVSGDYGDGASRQRVQDWVARLWADKDARIAALLNEAGAT